MLVPEDRGLLLLGEPSSPDEKSTGSKCLIQRVGYHIRTLYLFTKSDIKTVLAPQLIFIVSAVLCREQLTTARRLDDTDDTAAPLDESLRRLPLAVFWIWLNLLVCGISNQRLPSSILEDEHNKPWRPLAAKRLTPAQAQRLLMLAIPLVMAASLALGGGFTPAVTMMALLWLYNDLDGSGVNIWARNAINTGGIACFGSGALEVLSGARLLPRAWAWIGLTGFAVATTVQALDFVDIEGDRARGRHTIPILYGEKVARAGLAVAVVCMSAVCPAFWLIRSLAWVLPVGVGSVLAVVAVTQRDPKSDLLLARLWCLWISVLYALPLFVA